MTPYVSKQLLPASVVDKSPWANPIQILDLLCQWWFSTAKHFSKNKTFAKRLTSLENIFKFFWWFSDQVMQILNVMMHSQTWLSDHVIRRDVQFFWASFSAWLSRCLITRLKAFSMLSIRSWRAVNSGSWWMGVVAVVPWLYISNSSSSSGSRGMGAIAPQMELSSWLWPWLGWMCVQKSRRSWRSLPRWTLEEGALALCCSPARDVPPSAPQSGSGGDGWALCCSRTWTPWSWSNPDPAKLSWTSCLGVSDQRSCLPSSVLSVSAGTNRPVESPPRSAEPSDDGWETWRRLSWQWSGWLFTSWTGISWWTINWLFGYVHFWRLWPVNLSLDTWMTVVVFIKTLSALSFNYGSVVSCFRGFVFSTRGKECCFDRLRADCSGWMVLAGCFDNIVEIKHK